MGLDRNTPRGRARRAVPSACLGAALVLVGLAPSASAQTLEGVAQARYDEGRRLYEAGEFEAALVELRATLAARSSPAPRIYIARCLRSLERHAEAIEQYHLAWQEASSLARADPYYEAIRDAAQQEREAILDRVGWLTVHVDAPPPGLLLRVGERELPSQALDLSLPVDPGPLTVRAEAEGHLPASRELDVAPGARETVRLVLRPEPSGPGGAAAPPAHPRPPPPPPGPSRAGMMAGTFVSLAVTVAGVVASGVLLSLADRLHADLVDACPDFDCPAGQWSAGLEADVERGEAMATGCYVALGLSVAAAAATVILAVLTPWRADSSGYGRSTLGPSGWTVRW